MCMHVPVCLRVSLVVWWVGMWVSEGMVRVCAWLGLACWALAPMEHGYRGRGSSSPLLPAGHCYPPLGCKHMLVPGRVAGCSGMVTDQLPWWSRVAWTSSVSGGGGSSGFISVCLWHQGGVIAASHPHFQVHFLFLTHAHHKKTIEVSQVLYICFVYFYLYSILL